MSAGMKKLLADLALALAEAIRKPLTMPVVHSSLHGNSENPQLVTLASVQRRASIRHRNNAPDPRR